MKRRTSAPQASYRVTTMAALVAHSHGRHVHAHAHDGPHRHLLRLRRSTPIGADDAARAHSHHHGHGHSHGLIDPSISRSRDGVRAVGLSLAALGATALAQFLVFLATNSVALFADLIHNIGDAATAFPLGAAFLLRSARAERWAGLAVVLAIFVSACVAGAEAIDRLIDPQQPEHLVALAVAGGLGFAGNWAAATIRSRAGRRLDSPALIADGDHARADAYVSLAVIASAATVGVGLDIADPIIGLAITAVILRITAQSWQTVRGHAAERAADVE
jgi:divalent metal cation (Fe/Co/Zn/Cd) transporter